MDDKDFVPFETAKRLKTAGFDELCNYYYTSEDTPKEHIWLTWNVLEELYKCLIVLFVEIDIHFQSVALVIFG